MSLAADFENLKKSYKFPFKKLKPKQERVINTVMANIVLPFFLRDIAKQLCICCLHCYRSSTAL
jgi:hypothetical protein